MKSSLRALASIFVLLLAGLFLLRTQDSLIAAPEAEDQPKQPQATTFYASEPVVPSLSPAVRDLANIPYEPQLQREINPLHNPHQFSPDMGLTGSNTTGQDLLAANSVNNGRTPSPLFQFEGIASLGDLTPPDTNGDVGPNHYILMVNVRYAIYDKSGNLLAGPINNNALWAGFGGPCQDNNDGDPVVLYDDLADRWVLSQFAPSGGNIQCMAVSTTPDPMGTYYRYAFSTPDFPDYPKLGVWPNAYYMGTNSGFPNAYYSFAMDRVNMLAGNPATIQAFGGYPNFMMPADIDGPVGPDANTPGVFYTYLDGDYPDHPVSEDVIRLYEFDPDFVTPANSTFTALPDIPIAAFNYTVCGFFVQDCIPQPGISQEIDSLSYWPMARFAYRNFNSYETLVGNFTVDVTGADQAGIRWFELRDEGAGWDLYQEGTYAPDAQHRFMGSIAMDGSGNIALGYSLSSTTTNPSIRYATRLRTDPLGTLQAEVNAITGGRQMSGATRWGDYSSVSVDPSDNCTFWYAQEYHDVDASAFNWNTRVVVFRIPECSGTVGPDFTLSADPETLDICEPDPAVYNLTLGYYSGFASQVTLSASGVPSGYSASISPNPVITPTTSSVLTLSNTGNATAGSYNIDIVGVAVPTPTHTTTVQLNIYDASPGSVNLTSPINGAAGIGLLPTFEWDASAQAVDYDLEVATDAGFTNIIYSAINLQTTSHQIGISLDPVTTYYWRVTAGNICGVTTSTTFHFTTGNIQAFSYCRQPALVIPDNTTVSDNLNIGDSGIIADLDLVVDATHSWVGDTTFTLVNGSSVAAIDRPGTTGSGAGCSGDNIAVDLDDEGTDGPVENQCSNAPALFGNPTPNNPLSAFDGLDVNGTWTIQVTDSASLDTGVLNEWCIEGLFVSPGGPSIDLVKTVGTDINTCASGNDITVGYGDDVTYCYTVENTGDVTFTLHTLDDDQLGNIFTDFSYQLEPGASAYITVTTTLTDSVVNTADWYASNGTITVTASSVATVTVVVTPTIAVDPASLTSTQAPDSTADQTLSISNVGTGDLDWSVFEDNPGVISHIAGTAVSDPASVADVATDVDGQGVAVNLNPNLVAPSLANGTVLYDNGPLVNSPGTGAGGADESMLQGNLGMTIFGFGHQTINSNSVADDFTVSDPGGWIINTATFYAYQTGSTTTSTITGYNYNVYDGQPGAGGNVIFSGNTMLSSTWANIYRVTDTTSGNTQRPVMASVVDLGGLYLAPGTYWIEWQASGSLASGPWAPPVTINGQTTTGNGLQNLAGVWGALTDVGQQAVPFVLEGEISGGTCVSADDIPWITNISPASGTTAMGDSTDVTVTFDSTGVSAGTTLTATLCVESNDPVTPLVQVPITLTVIIPTYGVEVSGDDEITGGAGETVTYTVHITNTGDVFDTFDVTVADNTWTTSLSDSSIGLNPGEVGAVEVYVTIPSDAADGDSDMAMVTATSQGDNTVSDFAHLHTTADVPVTMYYIYLPYVARP